MVNRKIKVIASLEKDARNYFFVRMLYSYIDSEEQPKSVFEIEDEELKDILVKISDEALQFHDRFKPNSIIIYYPSKNKIEYGENANYTEKNKIIAGTIPKNHFEGVDYMLSVLTVVNLRSSNFKDFGEILVQYEGKTMIVEDFNKLEYSLIT